MTATGAFAGLDAPHSVLAGVRVLSLAEQFPGPYAGLIMADLGADVILVERPNGGDPSRQMPGFFESLNRGKRSVILDLKRPEGVAAFVRMAAATDVILEGYRPGTAKRLGVDYESLSEANHQLVYASISGYGQDGPYRSRPGHDVSYQGNAGLLFEQLEDLILKPPPEIAIGDLSAGLFTTIGIIGGLFQRAQTGRGTYIDVSMFDCLVSLMTTHLVPLLNNAGPPGFPHEAAYGVFKTSDESLITISIAYEDHFWRALCDGLGMNDVAHLGLKDRRLLATDLRHRIADSVGKRSSSEWEAEFTALGVPFGPVLSLDQVAADPHVLSRDLIWNVPTEDGLSRKFVRQPLKFGHEAFGPKVGAPKLGQHSDIVLAEYGFEDSEVKELFSMGVLGTRAVEND